MKKWENKDLSLEQRAKYYVKDMSKDDILETVSDFISSVPVLDECNNSFIENSKINIINSIIEIYPPISCVSALLGSEMAYDAAHYYVGSVLSEKTIDDRELEEIANKISYNKLLNGILLQKMQNRNKAKEKQLDLLYEEQIIAQSTVLLKNSGILPLSKEKVESLAIIGPNANCKDVLSGKCDEKEQNSILHGFLETYPSVRILYAKGCGYLDKLDESEAYEAIKVAEQAEIIVLAFGLTSEMEKNTRKNNQEIAIPNEQIELMEKLHKLEKPVVMLNFTGVSVDLSRADEICDAVLQCWYPYNRKDDVIAKILFNNLAPTGKLPFTMYKNGSNVAEKILYPFGYGLSYSKIEYYRVYLSSASVKAGEDIVLTVYAKNKGIYDTKDIVQVYLVDEQAKEKKPDMKLIASKLVELPKDKEIRISINIKADDMTIIKEDGTKKIEPGRFSVYVGGGQPDDRTAELYNRDCLHIGFLVE